MKSFVVMFLSVAIILSGCSGSSNNNLTSLTSDLISSKEVIASLQAENEKLKSELEELKNGPDKLLAKANIFYEKKDLDGLNTTLSTLKENHPDAKEVAAIQELSTKLSVTLKEEKEKASKEAADKAKEDKKRLATATSKMKGEHDEINGLTWYTDKTSVKYINENGFYIYFAKTDDGIVGLPHIKIQYAGEDWIFINKYIVKADDEKFEIDPGSFGVERDNKGGVWEYYDYTMKKSDFDMIKKIIESQKTTIRHQGDQTHYDRVITSKEKTALQNVLDAFEAIGGTEPTE